MRFLKERTEIAMAINSHKTTVIRLDLADADDYGLVSKNVLIDNGFFRDGMPYLVHAELRAYSDEKKFTFSSHGSCLSSSFGYYDVEKMLAYANAPIVKPDSDVIIAIVDSREDKKTAYCPVVLHTEKRVNPHCSTPISFVDKDNDATIYLAAAGVRAWGERA